MNKQDAITPYRSVETVHVVECDCCVANKLMRRKVYASTKTAFGWLPWIASCVYGIGPQPTALGVACLSALIPFIIFGIWDIKNTWKNNE